MTRPRLHIEMAGIRCDRPGLFLRWVTRFLLAAMTGYQLHWLVASLAAEIELRDMAARPGRLVREK